MPSPLPATQADQPLYVRDRHTGKVVRIPAEDGCCPVEVPYEYLQSAADVLWLLGRCTPAFQGLLDPRHRNA